MFDAKHARVEFISKMISRKETEVMEVFIDYKYPALSAPLYVERYSPSNNFREKITYPNDNQTEFEPNKDNRSVEELIKAANRLYGIRTMNWHTRKAYGYTCTFESNNTFLFGSDVIPEDAGVSQIKSIVLKSTGHFCGDEPYLLISKKFKGSVVLLERHGDWLLVMLEKGIDIFDVFIAAYPEAKEVVDSFEHWDITFKIAVKDISTPLLDVGYLYFEEGRIQGKYIASDGQSHWFRKDNHEKPEDPYLDFTLMETLVGLRKETL